MMKHGMWVFRRAALASLGASLMAALPCAHASTNLLDAYFGASYGHSSLGARDTGLIPGAAGAGLGGFRVGESAYQIIAGIRGLYLLGAEVDYFDLGSGGASPSFASALYGLTSAHISQKGEAAFAVLYLPVPIIDVYLKAGAARLTTDLAASAVYPVCTSNGPCPLIALSPLNGAVHTTETTWAAGAGVQWKLGNWAIRGEYERFAALGEHPSLVSVGLTRSFF